MVMAQASFRGYWVKEPMISSWMSLLSGLTVYLIFSQVNGSTLIGFWSPGHKTWISSWEMAVILPILPL